MAQNDHGLPNRTLPVRRAVLMAMALSMVVSIAIVSVALLRSRAFHVWYHTRMMYSSRTRAHNTAPDPDGGQASWLDTDALQQYQYHRRRLVEIGAVVKRSYEFEHIYVGSPQHEHVSRLLVSGNCPPYIDFESPCPYTAEPMTLTIWIWPTHVGRWDRFVSSHDVPSYKADFMDASR